MLLCHYNSTEDSWNPKTPKAGLEYEDTVIHNDKRSHSSSLQYTLGHLTS